MNKKWRKHLARIHVQIVSFVGRDRSGVNLLGIYLIQHCLWIVNKRSRFGQGWEWLRIFACKGKEWSTRYSIQYSIPMLDGRTEELEFPETTKPVKNVVLREQLAIPPSKQENGNGIPRMNGENGDGMNGKWQGSRQIMQGVNSGHSSGGLSLVFLSLRTPQISIRIPKHGCYCWD